LAYRSVWIYKKIEPDTEVQKSIYFKVETSLGVSLSQAVGRGRSQRL